MTDLITEEDIFGDSAETIPLERKYLGDEAFLPLADLSKLWCSTINEDTDAKVRQKLSRHPRRVAADLLRIFLAVKVPVILWGPIGARKTRSVEAMCSELDANGTPYKVISIMPSTMDSSILHGMYYVADEADGSTVMKRSLPEIADQIQRYHDETGGYVIVFLDEMTTCMPSQQHALLGLVTHGHFGPIDINKISTIAMAANPSNTVSAVNDLGEQFLNRCAHVAWFGERELFIEDWSSGFNNPSRSPDALTQWYTIGLMNERPDQVFRNNRWDTNDLVPYEMLEHTERIVTEHARVVKFINESFSGNVSDTIRFHYLVEVTRAMMGNDWANRMGSMCAKEHRRLNPSYYVDLAKSANITSVTTTHELKQALDDKMICDSSGVLLATDQVVSLGGSFAEKIVDSSTPLIDETIALWAIASSFKEDDQLGASLTSSLARVMLANIYHVRAGALDKSALCPNFVPDELRRRVAAVVKLSQSQGASS